jgi:hypothetical protein
MPLARYSSTSYTVMRSPRTQGLPPRLPGSIVMMPEYVIVFTLLENLVPGNRKFAVLACQRGPPHAGIVRGALAVLAQIFWRRGGVFLRLGHGSSLCGLRRSDNQTGERGAIFQKAPAAGIFRSQVFLL